MKTAHLRPHKIKKPPGCSRVVKFIKLVPFSFDSNLPLTTALKLLL